MRKSILDRIIDADPVEHPVFGFHHEDAGGEEMGKIRKTYSVDVDDVGVGGTSFRSVEADRLLVSASATTGEYREVYSLWLTIEQAQKLLTELRRRLPAPWEEERYEMAKQRAMEDQCNTNTDTSPPSA